jgi:hypothetical protein
MGKTEAIAERDAGIVDTPETLERIANAKLARALRVATTRYARQPSEAHWGDVVKAFQAAAEQRKGSASAASAPPAETKKAKKAKVDE